MRGLGGTVPTDTALAALLDHDLLGAAMRKTLAHGARLDARLERQGLARDTQFLVAGSILVGHSVVVLILVVREMHRRLKRSSLTISKANSRPRVRQSCQIGRAHV